MASNPRRVPPWIVLAILTATASTSIAPAAADEASGELAEQIDQVFARFDKPDSPGCAVAVMRQGQVIHKRGYGIANLDYGILIASDSVFYLASVSKQFTAACIALLVQEGKLSLDDPLSKFFPEFPEYDGGPITVRHLVHHTSGLRDYLTLMSLGRRRFEDVTSVDEVLELITRHQELNFAPGEKYLYSNSGYFLLSEIVRRAAGKSMREYAREKIFEPLGMKNTRFHDDRSEIVKNRVISYMPQGDGYQISYLANFDQVGSGGLLSTVDDLVLWVRNFESNQIGGDGFLPLMKTRGKLNDGSELDYAFGLSHGQYKGLTTLGHGGAMMGFRTHLVGFPDQRAAVIVLANLGTANPAELAEQVADVVLAEAIGESLKRYAGRYTSDELDVTYEIAAEGTDLVLKHTREVPGKLAPLDDAHAFSLPGTGIELHFTADDAGQITACRVGSGRAQNIRFAKDDVSP
ncbi:MAG: class A beta-lactamase-related serine hydrolase [Planctomycetota bacterium]|nr:MAG: class A beta-lactamase-related serine hydrolase [Planctomycetota bacterium]